ncbi:MAG: TetR/AcrR family transcriptional regulator [Actinomyces sp.]|uniref:TetR/AcrR family transcriptional regulator n=1 Tax=Actinomyces sp. TaxID=29317 RepID=UPI0026DD2DDF|nr:TetR/AcrR family transcriptional regulator [Actinomyces sp.]MDO4242312.1 TetR/AcrR family transcriptional regulator [Actinomyces sp.]
MSTKEAPPGTGHHTGPHPASGTPDRIQAPGDGLPQPGLRARKKAATMHHVQAIALELFSARGFDAVSIEEIAAAAEVSPSTIYRYFGTKEGLVVRDEYDEPLLAVVSYHVTRGEDPVDAFMAALDSIWEEHFVIEEAATRARLHLWMSHPSVRAASYIIIDERVDEFSRVLAGTGRWTFPEARLHIAAIAAILVTALRNWHELDLDRDWREHLAEVLPVLRSGWGPVAPAPEG